MAHHKKQNAPSPYHAFVSKASSPDTMFLRSRHEGFAQLSEMYGKYVQDSAVGLGLGQGES